MNYFLTQERIKDLQVELGELKTKTRLEIAERLKRAKELGDLSENAEYHDAKEEQAQLERRIEEIEHVVQNSVIIKKGVERENVDIGSTVEVFRDGKSLKFQIVGSHETKPEEGLISNESPLGRALVGKRVGDAVSVDTPQGQIEYKIFKIS